MLLEERSKYRQGSQTYSVARGGPFADMSRGVTHCGNMEQKSMRRVIRGNTELDLAILRSESQSNTTTKSCGCKAEETWHTKRNGLIDREVRGTEAAL